MQNYSMMSDLELLDLLPLKNERAFRALYNRYADSLYRYAYKLLPVEDKVQDIVQEVFITLYQKSDSLKHPLYLKGWLFTSVRNRAINAIRDHLIHLKHHQELGASTSVSEQAVQLYDLRQLEARFHAALSELTERCREVFILSRMGEMTTRQIADKLSISTQAVEKHISKALKVMEREIKNDT